MKIAVISDIHGNDTALQAVLEEARGEGVTRLFILGDLVGYYYHPDKVLNLLNDWEKVIISGNHERMLKGALEDEAKSQSYLSKYGHGLEFAIDRLTKDQIRGLVTLPDQKEVRVDGLLCLLCHGSPLDSDRYLYPDSDPELLESYMNEKDDFIFIGHSHYPFIHTKKNCSLVNVGSVGQSRGMGGKADWAILDTQTKKITFRKTLFAIDELIAEVSKNDPNLPYLHEVLTRGQNDKKH